ncbi:MAG: sulfate adenylyltransferase, partial [Parcubacteria group bacterium CG_4_9_14_0_2_um_filter_41_8]
MAYNIIITDGEIRDIINIATGAYRPITALMGLEDFDSVVRTMRLTNGSIWSMPIALSVAKDAWEHAQLYDSIVLQDASLNVVGTIEAPEYYTYNLFELCDSIFGTQDMGHPGVCQMFENDGYFIGGAVRLDLTFSTKIHAYHYTPDEVKQEKKKRGWNTMVAFQTRNIPHRSHEFLQKEALKIVDGLLVQPVLGKKKQGDFSDDLIIQTYEALFEHYHDKQRAMLSVLPIQMRYAGPREALHHALVRRNFGCTHMIIGRDHAGVGNYYGPFDAQNIFDRFDQKDLGIEILKFGNAHY